MQTYGEGLLARRSTDWSPGQRSEFVEAVCGVYGRSTQDRRVPHEMAAVFDALYGIMLGPDAKAALTAHNHEQRFGIGHRQHLAEELDRKLPTLTRGVIYVARRSGRDVPYFWRQVAELLGLDAEQLKLPAVS